MASIEKLTAQITDELNIDHDSITGGPRPGQVTQDRMLNDFYDLVDQEKLLTAILGKLLDGDASVTILEELPGVGADLAAKLRAHGFNTPADVADADPSALQQVPGVGEKKARALIADAGGDPSANEPEGKEAARWQTETVQLERTDQGQADTATEPNPHPQPANDTNADKPADGEEAHGG